VGVFHRVQRREVLSSVSQSLVASRFRQDPPHGADRVHRALHAGMV
jgi:hypothetical protein